jgi:small-conductance mechanosensitive channel/CRP-like cAMP-binding protein
MRQFVPILLEPERWPLSIVALAGFVFLWLVLRAVASREQRRRLLAPLIFVTVYIAIGLGIDLLPAGSRAIPYLGMLAVLLLLLAVGRLLTLLLIDWLLVYRFKRPTPRIVRDIVEGLLVVIALLLTLHAGGVDPNSLLTTSALLTAIVGLSLQDTLGNLFAGLSLQLQRSFAVGEWIQIDREGQQLGRVIEINWRATTVRTRDLAELTIPNGQLARSVILNFSRSLPAIRRTVFLSVPFQFPSDAVQRVILRSLFHQPGVSAAPEPSVVTHSFGDFGVQYAVRYYTSDFEQTELLDGVVRDRARSALRRAGISIATPSQPQLQEPDRDERDRAKSRDQEARKRAIHTIEFLRDLPETAIEALAGDARSAHYDAGEIVVREGELGDELYLCLEGELTVLRTRHDGSAQQIAVLNPGGLFGELSVMTGQQRTATVQALTPCELLVIAKPAFEPILASNPNLAELVSQRLAERQAELQATGRESIEEHRNSIEEHKGDLLRRVREFFSV